MTSGIFTSRDSLIRAIWDLQLGGMSQRAIREFCKLSPADYHEARAEALTAFDVTREDILRVKRLATAPTAWSCVGIADVKHPFAPEQFEHRAVFAGS